MSDQSAKTLERISLEIGQEITLSPVGKETEHRTFRILEQLGSGGTAIAYKVEYEGADSNTYLYVLKELYPVPPKGVFAISRKGNTLDIDQYDKSVKPLHSYKVYRNQFEAAYRVQNDLANGKEAVPNMTTSLPIGLYEDMKSSQKGNFALYGLFQYHVGHTLKNHVDSSLLELIHTQHQIAEVINSYHDKGFLWLDIKEANVNVVGSGAVLSVSMFDFGSLISLQELMDYHVGAGSQFALSFSPTSADLLLPSELEYLQMLANKSPFAIDRDELEDELHLLGEYGKAADIFLLGSMLFKRLFGRAPIKEDCEALQHDSFEVPDGCWLNGCHYKTTVKIRQVLKKCLNYEERDRRYQSVLDYKKDLKAIFLDLCVLENLSKILNSSKEYVSLCCSQYLNTILTGTNGKFERLQSLRDRFDSHVTLRSVENDDVLLPATAIDSSRLVFLYGDGGMGKSTALYDYMQQTSSIALYIELSQYRFIDRGISYILRTIMKDICNNFMDATIFDDTGDAAKLEDVLLQNLKTLNPNDPRPEYVLLLDGYNEISREDRGAFDNEVAEIINTWTNVRIVITGRNQPTDYEGKEIDTYEKFRRYEFIGISEEERYKLVMEKYPERAERIQKDMKLWDVLRIPMFMGMFLQLNIDTTAVVHTRGEILDQFIMQTETEAAKQIARGQTCNADNADIRHFIVKFALPYVANEMDQRRTFSLTENQTLKCSDMAWDLYSSNETYMLWRIMDINVPDKPYSREKLDEKTKHIMKIEASYCYDTTDSEVAFTHQYFRDYFAAKYIQNILTAAQALGKEGYSQDEQLQFTKDNGLDYTWSDDVCILLGEIIGDYKNEPGYTEE